MPSPAFRVTRLAWQASLATPVPCAEHQMPFKERLDLRLLGLLGLLADFLEGHGCRRKWLA